MNPDERLAFQVLLAAGIRNPAAWRYLETKVEENGWKSHTFVTAKHAMTIRAKEENGRKNGRARYGHAPSRDAAPCDHN